jgi:hypothetical protein
MMTQVVLLECFYPPLGALNNLDKRELEDEFVEDA